MEGKNVYELPSLSSKDEETHLYESMNPQHGNTQEELQAAMSKKLSKRSACSPPFIILTVLLCLVMILLMTITCLILAHMFVIEECRSCSSSVCVSSTAKTGLFNFTEWADDVVSKVSNNVSQSFSKCNIWADDVVSKVSNNVSQSFSKCNIWADMVNNCTNGTHSIKGD